MFFDGSFTQQGLGARILFITPQQYSLPKAYKKLFPYTNKVVEYEALVNDMKMVIEWHVDELKIFGNSKLVINQESDVYQTKDDKLVPYKQMIDDLCKYFVQVSFQQVPRVDKKATDTMATLASMLKMLENDFQHELLVETLLYPTYDSLES